MPRFLISQWTEAWRIEVDPMSVGSECTKVITVHKRNKIFDGIISHCTMGPILFQYGEIAIIFMSRTDIPKDLLLIRLEYSYIHRLPSRLKRWEYITYSVCHPHLVEQPAAHRSVYKPQASTLQSPSAHCFRSCHYVNCWECQLCVSLNIHALPNKVHLFYRTRVFQTGIVFTVCYNILYTSILINTVPN